MIKRELGCAHRGNGLGCYDRLHEEHGDYQTVAHISNMREITYYVELSNADRLTIEAWAAFKHPNISQTQQSKVFFCEPEKRFDETKYKIAIEHYNSGPIFTGMTLDGEEVTLGSPSYRETARALYRETNPA